VPPASPEQRPSAEPKVSGDTVGKTLNLAGCIRIAFAHSPDVRASYQATRSAAARVGSERSAYLPEVDAWGTGRLPRQSFHSGLPSNISSSNSSVGIGASYLLFDGGERAARLEGSSASLRSAGFEHNAVLRDVALKVEEAYYALLAAQWSQKVEEENSQSADYHVRLSQARFDNGLVPRSDVLKAETGKANATLALVRARNSVRIAKGQLASAMGVKVSAPIRILDISPADHSREVADVDNLLEEAVRSRPELHAAVAKVQVAKTAVKAAKSQWWPRISANTAYYGWQDQITPSGQSDWSLGVGLTLPLFTGFRRKYDLAAARAEKERVRAQYETLLRGVELEVWTSYSRVLEADEAIKAATSFVASARETARLTEGEYKNGTGDMVSVIDARTALTSARDSLVQARLNWYTATAQLERAIGKYQTGAKPK